MKKQTQLGMNPSTASGRLVKDILFMFVVMNGIRCYRCGECLTRDTFSIEHKIPWLHSEDPVKLYFDLNNIAFSHYPCNIKAGRRETKTTFEKRETTFAQNVRKKERWAKLGKKQQQQLRRENYLKYGV